jgi:hypothetical protein
VNIKELHELRVKRDKAATKRDNAHVAARIADKEYSEAAAAHELAIDNHAYEPKQVDKLVK